MYQQITILGNVGKDPEMKYTPAGKAVTSFNVATNRKYLRDGETITDTVWFRVSAWDKLAELVNQYLHKGNKVFVQGRLVADPETGSPRVWTRQDGTTGATFEVTADIVRFLSGKDGEEPF